MEKSNWNILSTRPLDQSLIEEAAAKGFHIDCLSFIDTEPVRSAAVEEQIKAVAAQNGSVVFTSMNAVEAVQYYLQEKPNWRIYAIGNTTKELVNQYIGTVWGAAENAGALADTILENAETEVTFFCGDIRRDELPEKLRDAGITLDEVIVYNTILLPHTIEKQYDGILFFSPSAVHAFFTSNPTLPETTEIFAIGTTTAAAINTYTNNRILIADSPSKENLVREMMEYFSNQKQPNE